MAYVSQTTVESINILNCRASTSAVGEIIKKKIEWELKMEKFKLKVLNNVEFKM
jgi:hypothetical protein